MSEIWFSSDLHFWHDNIIKFCNRPFSNGVEMTEQLVDFHNQFVKPEDTWYCLGDITMRRGEDTGALLPLGQMNGHKHLFLGNHDHFDMRHYRLYFEKIMGSKKLDGIEFTHIPIHPFSMNGSKANVHGHIHSNDSPSPKVTLEKNGKLTVQPYINICVEKTNYHPINFDEVKRLIKVAIDTYKEGCNL